MNLIKRKVSTKVVPPDTSALKLLLEYADEKEEIPLSELEAEREKLLELLKGEMYGTDTKQIQN